MPPAAHTATHQHEQRTEPTQSPLRRLVKAWQGVVLSLVGIVSTVWLGLNGQLGLYIHPRYFWFTLIMAAIAAVCAVAACLWLPARREASETHEPPGPHEQGAAGAPRARNGRALAASLVGILTVVGAVVALLVLPPTTLTAATATQRSVNAGVGPASAANAAPLIGGDSTQFTVRDWAILLRQNPDPNYFAEHTAEISGFVLASEYDPENVFYVARFIITCCAVDAQPVGVPVYMPGWKTQHEPDSWVAVSGTFVSNPAADQAEKFVLTPSEISTIDVPEQPYVY